MATIDLMENNGTKLVIVKYMPQSTKRFILRKYPRFGDLGQRSKAMILANIGLTQSAISHRGDFGTVSMPNGTVISKAAFDIGRDLRGKSYGGMSYSERLRQHQQTAEGTLAKLQSALNGARKKGSAGSYMGAE